MRDEYSESTARMVVLAIFIILTIVLLNFAVYRSTKQLKENGGLKKELSKIWNGIDTIAAPQNK